MNIISGFINQRNAIKPTSARTKGKQAYESVWVVRTLGDATLDVCTVNDLLNVASKASSGEFTKNTRQTKIMTLKALALYIHRFHHPIENLDLLMKDVKAGSASKNRKEALTLEQWDTLINLPMSARDRALLAVMYDGYHRPMEVLILKWSDLKINERGDIEYDILFKTDKGRCIVQKPGTTEILEAWRRECGAALTDDTYIFPAPDGSAYRTITVLAKMFRRLKAKTGIKDLKPSTLRTSAITHDVDAGLPISYICLRAWGEPFNDLVNLYTRPDSAKIQRDQHDKTGLKPALILGTSGKFTTRDDRLAETERRLALLEMHFEESTLR
jgi:integrase